MSEPEDENATFYLKSKEPMGVQTVEPDSVMDFDLELDDSWPLDQVFYASSPMSPFFLSSSEQPCSPPWVFSDVDQDNPARSANSTVASGLRLFDYPQLLSLNTGNTDQGSESPIETEDKRRLAPVRLGLISLEPNRSCVIKERMTQALRYFKESTEQHVLAQVWAPVRNGGRYVLTTSGQPFILDPNSNGLHQYRMASLMYMFSVDGESDGEIGLPGRVFLQKMPEWSPDVQYYSNKEYPRLNHAMHYNVRGTLALPVFESTGQSCIGVLELILTSQKINYAPEVDLICKALEAVNLKSSKILDHPKTQIRNKGRHSALVEILEILTVVCETHKLPLAQTWVPCRHRSILAYGGGLKKSCTSFDGSCMGQICMSTSDVAFYVVDAHLWGFREACAEHHLQKGQGVAGRAFSSYNSCFCNDITQFSKTEYPLVHYARMFGLTSCFAICVRSIHSGDDDYILEFFLPPSLTDSRDQQILLNSILKLVNQHFQSLKVASGNEFDEKRSFQIIKASMDGKLDPGLESVQISQSAQYALGPDALLPERETVRQDSLGHQLDAINDRGNVINVGESPNAVTFSETKDPLKKSVRKRGKAEKSISLEVLQQHFAGSLKDAAKSLGVCPTTMKRICRQHGISRWPSRKINKVNRSLVKLKRVIESVQGAEGAFNISSPLAVGSTWPHPNPSGPKPSEPQQEMNGSPTCKTPRSGRMPEFVNVSKTGGGSREVSIEIHTCHGSCQSSPANEASNAPVTTEPQELFGGMLIEDAGSSKDLRSLCPLAADAIVEEQVPASFAEAMPHVIDRHDMKTVTIKATYREDIIRFRAPSTCGIGDLKEEVAKRLKLEVGTFDIKYLDDDHERVLIACDADLQECMDTLGSSGSNMIRLSVHDVMSNLGSSCESGTRES